MRSARELTDRELRDVSGGMKADTGVRNPDVVDARGGSMVIYGVRLTYDQNGHCSSIAPVKT
ncbi:hypothetical protein A5906_35315 [Bradyrhizobium sacchari]|uniref:Uncharacterized protein n=1 Tax=Bradyrhizobium sacchari TaxID=1399419 RepID=A0A560JNS0_9BRAD|nr:hypothetical protein [Bradyrhizobium sacchari]OPY98199.1 hypothetical protein A5906_35315 [Bradyrhizobium sacchari]TWB58809.1 hypothetical protein FBZ94_10585 [Bradyrhizobium sacchari]TWB72831.1 hypothetical protein FBZ95_106546 [Bradyrhizobium sacchari]